MSRLERDRPSIKPIDKFTFKEVVRSASSPHVIILFIMFFMTGTMLFGLALFLPSIVSQFGFSPTKTQLLSVGPYAVGFFGERFVSRRDLSTYLSRLIFSLSLVALVTIISAFWSDRYESRGVTTALIALLAVAGFSLFLGNTFSMLELDISVLGVIYLTRRRTKICIIRGAVLDGSRLICISPNPLRLDG